jgi:hypothetical protein
MIGRKEAAGVSVLDAFWVTRELEQRYNRYIVSCEIADDGRVENIVWADIGPLDDFVVEVHDFRPRLHRQTGYWEFEPVDVPGHGPYA